MEQQLFRDLAAIGSLILRLARQSLAGVTANLWEQRETLASKLEELAWRLRETNHELL